MTNNVVAATIERTIKRGVEKYLQMATKYSTVQNATVGYPLLVGEPIYGDEKSSDTEFISLALTVVFLYYLASFLAATTMVSYRVCNIAVRDYVAGVRFIESILSQMIVYGLLLIVESILMYIVLTTLIRNLIMSIAWHYLTLVIFAQVWCGLCFGFFVASVTKSGVQAGCIVFCCLSASMILCGVLWPLNGQPDWLLTIVNLLPHTFTILGVNFQVCYGL
ncbi:ABC-2 type transporter [Popillia japonica]|uniref:ABC-2 type transporter n=1 Tax=Popillia japonica TaxID=7064 RepID=A0AAW1LD85_POPJA